MKTLHKLFSATVLLAALTGCCHKPIAVNEVKLSKLSYKSVLKIDNEFKGKLSPELEKMVLKDHTALLITARDKYLNSKHKDYTCTFAKLEHVNGNRIEQKSKVKFRVAPYSLYMKFIKGGAPAKMMFYREGKDVDSKTGKSQMIAAVPLFFKLVPFLKSPTDPMVMAKTLRPCTAFGFKNTFKNLIDIYQLGQQNGDCTQYVAGMTKVGGRDCVVILRKLGKNPAYPAAITEICLDVETLLPLKIVGYDWNGKCTTLYTFTNVKFDRGLGDKDFSPKTYGIDHQ